MSVCLLCDQEIRKLGALFEKALSFRGRVNRLLTRAKVRHCFLAKFARWSWVLETGVPRLTHESLLSSLTRYGLAVYGSGIYEADFRDLETLHSNAADPRVIRLGVSTKTETLNAVAGVFRVRNLYLRHCADLVDNCLRATGGTICFRLSAWARRQYGTPP